MWHTRLTKEYGIELPFVSPGMSSLAMPELVAAVSNAGGLGLLGASPLPPPAMQSLIQATKSLTSRPFGVDFVIADTAFGPTTTEEYMEICIAENIKVILFFWDIPPKSWVERLHTNSTKVWVQVGSVEQAVEAVRVGADAIIAQGSEAGGHNRTIVALSSLVPAVVDAIASSVPVIAAGAIADGRTVASALALGAEGVCVGTRLITSREAYAHEEYKKRVVAATADRIVRTSIFGAEWPDQPMRVICNRVVSEWGGRDNKTPQAPDPQQFIGRTLLGDDEYPIPKFSIMLPTPDTSGDFEQMCLVAAENVGLVKEIKSAGEIVHEMMGEARQVISERLAGILNKC